MKPGRNDPCPCGSNRKYKHCCGSVTAAPAAGAVADLIREGERLRAQGRRRAAMETLQQAVNLDPKRADGHFYLGRLLLETRRPRRAADSFLSAIALQPDLVAAYLGLATAQRMLGIATEALTNCERALALAPQSPEALVLLGELRADHGEFAAAQELFERARAANPNFAPTYSSIASHRRMTRDDSVWLRSVQSLLARQPSLTDEVQLRFALGKYYDDVCEYDAAFASFQRANELNKRFGGTYDPAHLEALVERVMSRHDVVSPASDSQEPVFIVGMPRSGTSLAEQILASHPSAAGAGEIVFWNRVFDMAPNGTTAPAYLQRLHQRAMGALRTIDKMPANFLYAGLIHTVFPRARIIHMQRHPFDTCLSIYFQNFFNVGPYANDLSHLRHYYQQYLRVMAHWRKVLPAQALLDVPYEALVQDPQPWTRRMLEFIGLPWDPQCLQFHRTDWAVITASRWQVRQKIHSGSVGRWRNYVRHLEPLRPLAPGDE